MPHPKLMVMVSFCWKINFLPSKIKKQIRFIEDVLEINDQSCCILSGPPCITFIAKFIMYKLEEEESEEEGKEEVLRRRGGRR